MSLDMCIGVLIAAGPIAPSLMTMPGCPHTSYRKGQKIIIFLNNGNKITDKYIEKKSGVVVTKKNGRIQTKDIRSISIFRG